MFSRELEEWDTASHKNQVFVSHARILLSPTILSLSLNCFCHRIVRELPRDTESRQVRPTLGVPRSLENVYRLSYASRLHEFQEYRRTVSLESFNRL
ncbi:uncharacterized protein RSE6_07045 [Rhynchosporium secalis]|uniref:Uncharacterized protein n=1 Tax=Rhynchosporium secalis TaxID=38038 RepID=A0A1E1MBZ0_RHYSE|nr:uncharacterized protein RSE6_07045 [Rhynchosporium secalis]